MEHFFIYCDGGARGNPGPAGYGFVIYDKNKKELAKGSKYLGETTNNQAEYQGVIAALKSIKYHVSSIKDKDIEVEVFLDSQLIVEQMNGRYKIKNQGLKPLFWQIRDLIMVLGGRVSFQYIPREQNKEADKLVNLAIDKGIK